MCDIKTVHFSVTVRCVIRQLLLLHFVTVFVIKWH